jgi:hypothetical protein
MLTRKLSIIVIPVIGVALFACGMARANLVTNGNFNLYGGSAPKNDFVYVQPTDWTGSGLYDFGVEVDAPGTADNVSDPGIPVYGPFPAHGPSGNNNNFIEADGDPSYSFSFNQTISGLTVGQNYNVSFNQAAGQQSGNLVGPTTEQWEVSLGSSTQFSSLMSTPQGGIFPWEAQTLLFTASSTSEVLSFLAVGTPSGAPPMVFLDGVDMESTVPEPSAFLLLAGVGAVLAIGRLGRRVRAYRVGVAA